MSSDATLCAMCGGEFSSKRVIIDGIAMHQRCAVMSYPSHTPDDMVRLSEKLEKLQTAVKKAICHAERNGMENWPVFKALRKAMPETRAES